MKLARRTGILLFVAALVITTLACGGTAAEPTSTTSPTNTPPPATETPLPPPPATDTPAPVETSEVTPPEIVAGQLNVREVSGFADEYDYWSVFGLISNDTDQAVNDIEIEIQLLDANGAIIYTDTTYPSLYSLAPGELSPFSFYSYEEVLGVETIVATIVGNGSADLNRASLDFYGMTLYYDPEWNDVYVSGNVVNNNAEPVDINNLAGTLLDATGAVVSANTAWPYMYQLAAGEEGPFTILFDAPPGTGASLTEYEFYLDAELTEAAETFDVVISEDNYNYLDAYDDFHLLGTFTNNSDVYLNARLVAGLYDDANNAIDSSSLYLPVPVAPGASMPFDFDVWGPTNYLEEAYNASTIYWIQVDWYSTYEAFTAPVQLTTSDDANTSDSYSVTFTGNVVNNSGQDFDSATVLIALYDKTTGQLVAFDYAYASGPIANNASAPYEAYVYGTVDLDLSTVDIVITAYGQ